MPGPSGNLHAHPKNTAFRAVVGARGWQHDAWKGSYYPSDLPPQWRLAYYANDFPGVLVPFRDWSRAPPEEWRQWRADSPDGFALFLEVGASEPSTHTSAAEVLNDRFGGWVDLATPPRAGMLGAASMDRVLADDDAEIVLVNAGDMADRRRLGRQLRALAARGTPPRALIGVGGLNPAALADLRVLAEITGLA